MRTLSLLVGALAAAIACAGAPPPDAKASPSPPGPELGKPFALAAGETASLDSGKIVVRFTGVTQDSRCPKNEQCVWAGDAQVDLEVRLGDAAPTTISLHTNRGASDAEAGGYSIALVDVAPLPISGRSIAPQEYRVTLSVGRGAAPSPAGDAPVR